MILAGGGTQTWMTVKSGLKAFVALVIFLAYIFFAAVIIREAEWRNEQLNSEAANDHTIVVDQLRFELVANINDVINSPQNNSNEADIKQLLDAYHNASYVYEEVVADGIVKLVIADDNGVQLWSLPRSLTFVLTTFTLIGYGDIVPLTDGGRLTIVWLTVFGAVFMLLLMSSASNAQSRMIHALYDAVTKYCGYSPSQWPEDDDDESLTTYAATQNTNKNKLILDHFRFLVRRAVARFILSLLFLAISISLGAFVMKLEEKEWSWLTSYYFTFQTFSTIGFGDVMPQRFATKEFTPWYIIFFFAYIICGLSVTSAVIGFGISLFQTVTTTANAFLPIEKQPYGDKEEGIDPEKDQPLGDNAKKHQYIP